METFIPILIAIILFSISLFFFIRSNQNQPNTNKKKRQKFYTDKETTPMAFHQFYAYTILPLSVLSCIRHFIMSALSAVGSILNKWTRFINRCTIILDTKRRYLYG